MFNSVKEKVIVGVLTALTLGAIYAMWNAIQSIDVGIGVPTGAVLAFDQDCPKNGWRPYTEATGRFIVGAGTSTHSKHDTWQKVLPDGNLSPPIPLSTYELSRSGGEETHIISKMEMPSHDHTFTGSAIQLAGKGSEAYNDKKSPALGTIVAVDALIPTGSISSNGSGEPHNNLPPYYPLNFCIKN
ncbi:hypothetical protein [Falsiphaeobacter marinintestinus]|uniref:hypothetical protein n=1 Tax=Falsiphaeobacter marinintestinus TaxID=1492905 RepID=UPI0011B6DD92|nr:hypothetical protein [Phaeobacter marinintestinus]